MPLSGSQKELLMLSTILGVGKGFSLIVGFRPGNIDHLAGERNTDNTILNQRYKQEHSEYFRYITVNLQVCSTAIFNGLNLPANSFLEGREKISSDLFIVIG